MAPTSWGWTRASRSSTSSKLRAARCREAALQRAARRSLADQLMSLSAAAGELSDRLSMRHFSLTSPEAYSQAN